MSSRCRADRCRDGCAFGAGQSARRTWRDCCRGESPWCPSSPMGRQHNIDGAHRGQQQMVSAGGDELESVVGKRRSLPRLLRTHCCGRLVPLPLRRGVHHLVHDCLGVEVGWRLGGREFGEGRNVLSDDDRGGQHAPQLLAGIDRLRRRRIDLSQIVGAVAPLRRVNRSDLLALRGFEPVTTTLPGPGTESE